MSWIFDMESIPKGSMVDRKGPKGTTIQVHVPDVIIVAVSDGQTVTLSRWLPKEQRWNMMTRNQKPVAWMPFPKHPHGPDGETK